MESRWILKASRVESIADGIFAVAMTILVLNVNLPITLTATTLWSTLEHGVLYNLFLFIGSFIIVGTYWVGMCFQYGFLAHVNRYYLWINILLLMAICVVPFSANLLARFPHSPLSISFYAINLCFASLMQLCAWYYALTRRLNVEAAYVSEVQHSIYRRILIAPIFYAISLVLAHFNMTLAFVALIIPPVIHLIPGGVDKYSDQHIE